MKNKYLKFCDHIAKACGAFAVLALLLSILVIVELVFERYFFQRAITWQTELVTMLLVASTFIGSAYVLSEKAHVSMEWIYDFLSKKNILRPKIFKASLIIRFSSHMIDLSEEPIADNLSITSGLIISSTSNIFPSPNSPHAISPISGPKIL